MFRSGDFERGWRADRGRFHFKHHDARYRWLADFSAVGIANARARRIGGRCNPACKYFEYRFVERLVATLFDDCRNSESPDSGCEDKQYFGASSWRRNKTAGGGSVGRKGERVSGADDVWDHAGARTADPPRGRN